MSKYHNTYQRIYQEKYRFLDTVTQPLIDISIRGLYANNTNSQLSKN